MLDDGNLNVMSPIGDDDSLLSSSDPDVSASRVPSVIRRVITEMSKLPKVHRAYLVLRDLDAAAVGRVLLATFVIQQHPIKLRTNFYLCMDVQQRHGRLPRLSLWNVTRDHIACLQTQLGSWWAVTQCSWFHLLPFLGSSCRPFVSCHTPRVHLVDSSCLGN